MSDYHEYTWLVDHANGDTEEVISWEDLPEIIAKVKAKTIEACLATVEHELDWLDEPALEGVRQAIKGVGDE